eukprot:Skav210000  [mRNA]  locus=scaffold3061:101156:110817:+ [translate_table: standard]
MIKEGEDKEKTRRRQGEDKEKTRRRQGEDKEKTRRRQGEDKEKTRRRQGEEETRGIEECLQLPGEEVVAETDRTAALREAAKMAAEELQQRKLAEREATRGNRGRRCFAGDIASGCAAFGHWTCGPVRMAPDPDAERAALLAAVQESRLRTVLKL